MSLESSKRASENLVSAVKIYTEINEGDRAAEQEEIDLLLDNFSGSYFGWGDEDVKNALEELIQSPEARDKQKILHLITSYENHIRTRLQSFDTLLYFLIAGVLIQFIFLIITNHRAKSAAEKLRNSEEVLKLLNSEREKERLRISSMLHDSVLQDIGSLLLSPNMKDSGTASEKLREISANLREMTYQIAPLQLNTSGLKDAVEDLISNFKKQNACSVKFSINGYKEDMLNNESRLVFYRILQESLANIHKHAQAENVEITITASHPFLIMRIRDDGIGLHESAKLKHSEKHKHIGMLLMNEQAKSIGAVLSGESTLPKGTSITLKYRIERTAEK